jgi:hypothetical protein
MTKIKHLLVALLLLASTVAHAQLRVSPNVGWLIDPNGLVVGYVDQNNVERDLGGNPIPPETTPPPTLGSQGPQGIQGPAGPAGPAGAAGAGINYRGAYSSSATYQIDDYVTYNGSGYVCNVANTTNVLPTNTTNWGLLVLQGATGATGPQGPQGPTGPQGPAGSSSGKAIAQDGAVHSVTGTTTPTALVTIPVAGNTLTTNGALQIDVQFSMTNDANNKTVAVTFGGQTVISTTNTTAAGVHLVLRIANRNVTNQQVVWPSPLVTGTTTSAPTVLTVDTTVAQNLVFVATLGNTADTISVESYSVQVVNQ